MSDFQDYVQGLQMLGGVLALPRSAQYAQESAEAHRRMLEDTGLDPKDVQAMYPDAPLHWLRAGPDRPGVGGKILGGIGDVGALLSTIAGAPIGPPRMSIPEVAEASKLRSKFKEQQALGELGKTETDPVAKALLGTGSMDAYGRYKAAQLRGAGGGPWHGTPAERVQLTAGAEHDARAAQRQTLIDAGNDPKDVDRWIATGGTLAAPGQHLTQGEMVTQREQAEEDVRKKQADRMKLQPGTPEYDAFVYRRRPEHVAPGDKEKPRGYFIEKALATQRQRVAAGLQDSVDTDAATKAGNAEYDAYYYSLHPEKKPPEPGPGPGVQQPAQPPSEAFDVPRPPLSERAGRAGPQGSPEGAAFGGSTPSTTTTTTTQPSPSPLGGIHLIPDNVRTPDQRAAVEAVKAEAAAAAAAGKPIADDIVRQRLIAIPGLVAK